MKRFSVIMLATVMAFSLFACGKSDDSLTKLSDKHAIIAGFEANHAPFGFKSESGAYSGFDLALAQKIASKLELTLNLRVLEDESAETMLEDGSVDFLCSNLPLLNGKDRGALLSEPILVNKIVVAVRTGAGIDSLSQLEEKTVALVPNTAAEEAFEGKRGLKSKAEVIEKESADEALAALNDGTVDAIVVDEMFVRNAVKNGASVLMLDEALAEKEYCIAFRKEDKALRDRVNEILKELLADETLQDLSIQWFGADVITLKE